MGIRAKFDVLVAHGFTEVNLKTIITNVAPVVHLNHMKPSVIFPRTDLIREQACAWHIYCSRRFHAQRFVRTCEVVFVLPILQGVIRVKSIFKLMVFEEFILHGTMKTLNLSLRLRMLDPPMDREYVQAHQPLFKLRITVAKAGELCAIV